MKKKLLLSIVVSLQSIFTFSQPNFNWAYSISEPNFSDLTRLVITDDSNNVITCGIFSDPVDMDPGPATNILTPKGYEDIFMQKVSSNGDLIWVKQFGGGTYSDIINGIAVDHDGNIYATGQLHDTLDCDPGSGTYNLIGSNDIFILKLNSNGDFIWGKSIGNSSPDGGYAITLDEANDVYITGIYSGTSPTDFDPSSGTYFLSPSQMDQMFLLKLRNNGDFSWVYDMGNAGTDYGYALNTDKFGNVYATGVMQYDGPSSYQVFVTKLDTAGTHKWTKKFGNTSGYDAGYSILTDDRGNVYTAGTFSGLVDFDPSPAYYPITGYGTFLHQLDSTGNFKWVKVIGGDIMNTHRSMVYDKDYNFYMCGTLNGTGDFNPDTLSIYNLTSAGAADAFVLKLDSIGTFVWARNIGSNANEIPFALAIDTNYNIYCGGLFNGVVDFDPNSGIHNLNCIGAADAFVFKWDQEVITGIDNFKNDTEAWVLYPNPGIGDIQLFTNNNSAIATIEVYDNTGRLIIKKFKSKDQSVNLDLSNETSGLYLIRIISDEKVSILKYILQK